MKYILNIDADEILYNAAFAVEETIHRVITPKGQWSYKAKDFSKKTIIAELGLQGKELDLDYTITTIKLARGPASFSIQCLKNILTRLSSLGEIKLWLTSNDKSNFRFNVAKTNGPNGAGYKAGRPAKPLYYGECREYLLKRGAEEVFGMEADDMLGIQQTDNTVAVHIDKDINRILGKHYNWKTNERYIVEQPGYLALKEQGSKKKLVGYGNAWFFAQMLTGDRVDNIPSCGKGMGDMTALKLLVDCKTDQDYYNVVVEQYKKVYEDEYELKINEMADLLYIMDSDRITGSEYIKRFVGGK